MTLWRQFPEELRAEGRSYRGGKGKIYRRRRGRKSAAVREEP